MTPNKKAAGLSKIPRLEIKVLEILSIIQIYETQQQRNITRLHANCQFMNSNIWYARINTEYAKPVRNSLFTC
jgi:hypothetical protein